MTHGGDFVNNGIYKVIINEKIAKNVYKMILDGDTSAITAPGQFINIRIEGFYLRRPISICDYDANTITIIYKVVGQGTQEMSSISAGSELDVLVGLGNGYDTTKSGSRPLLIGGGVGVPPLYKLCKCLISEGKKPIVVLGFNTADEVFYEDEFNALGADVFVTTVDGTHGIKGFVTDAFKDMDYTYFYTCGPMPMFKAVNSAAKTSGQFSFEERMGCGFGACMGCTHKTTNGSKRVCKEGPVFVKEEIVW
ncbi:MAG: dihydroorotate dehydrogenase electron transfer subunit [Clostridia bacterium]|nr:dihydroorotate dehydrogenase electron transfer subunit [Clostridia bacterium]